MTDSDLLHQYSSLRSEEAFAALVQRYGGLVYSAALRQTGSSEDAEDITQVVFMILARKAAIIDRGTILAGWLLRTTHFVVLNARRRQSHRSHIEMNVGDWYQTETETAWKQIAPLLDEALVSLSEKDHDAVALRFFEQKTFREIAQILGTSEDGAQKRVSRALEKLRTTFIKRGIVVPSAIVIAALSSKAVQAILPQVLTSLSIKAISGGAKTGPLSELTERSLSALASRRARKLLFRLGAIALLALLTLLAVRRLRPAHPGLQSPSQISSKAEFGPIRFTPEGAQKLQAQRSPGQLLLHVIDSERIAAVAKAQLRSISGTEFPNLQTNFLTTDSDGTALVSFVGDKEGLWNWRIEIQAAGYEPKFVNWGAVRGDILQEIPSEYTVKMRPGHMIGGIIADEKGNPIPEARVFIRDSSRPEAVDVGRGQAPRALPAHIETTDSEGRWTCNHIPQELETVAYDVSHPDYIGATFRALKISPSTNVILTDVSEDALRSQTAVMILKRGLVVKGSVLDEMGRPIPGAKVTENRAWSDPAANQITGSDGKFRFGNVAPADLILTAQAAGFLADDKTVHPVSQFEEFRFSLKQAGVLRGQVVNERGGPVPKCWVLPLASEFQRRRFESTIFTDEQGRFEWLSAPPSQKLFTIRADGYKPAGPIELTADGSDQRITAIKSFQPAPVRILGQVLDAKTGQPIQDFQVWAVTTLHQETPSNSPRLIGLAQELRTTGTNGKFSFLMRGNKGPLEKMDIEIRAEGYLPAGCSLQGPLTNGCNVAFRAEAIPSLTGIVQMPNGEPAEGAQVFLGTLKQAASGALETESAYMSLPGQLDMRFSKASSTVTGSAGQFSLQARAKTGTLVAVHKTGFAQLPVEEASRPRLVRLEPWGAVSGALTIINQPGSRKAILLDNVPSEEKPVLRVHLSALTDSRGHFAFGNVPPGEWRLSPHSVRIEVEPGRTAQIALGGGGRKVVGRVIWKDSTVPISCNDCSLMLATQLPGLPAAERDTFASEIQFATARREWFAKRSQFLGSPAGKAAVRGSRAYSLNLASDGTFSCDEVLPGTYELTFLVDPLRQNDRVARCLSDFRRQINVPEAAEGAILDIGALELKKP